MWSILHPSTRFIHGNDNDDESRGSANDPSSSSSASQSRTSNRQSRNSSHHQRTNTVRSSQPNSAVSEPRGSGEGQDPAPPLPPPSRHMQRGGNMQRSHSVQDSGLRPPNFTHLPPLPPYSQRSCSSDVLVRGANSSRRSHFRTIPTHGPHMASTATFNPYLSPSISETGSDGEDELYAGGSECYVTMSSRDRSAADATYLPSTQSDPGTTGRSRGSYRPSMPSMGGISNPPTPLAASDTSSAPSDTYITSVDSECSGASYRVNSPPPIYREVDEEHSVPINFDTLTPGGGSDTNAPNSAAISLVSPIIPIAGSEPGSAVFNFDAAAVLTRTQELEGELQRLRAAMTCRLCKQNPIGATFCPCGHTVCCYQCAQRMHSCWECDETVTSVQRMLLTR